MEGEKQNPTREATIKIVMIITDRTKLCWSACLIHMRIDKVGSILIRQRIIYGLVSEK